MFGHGLRSTSLAAILSFALLLVLFPSDARAASRVKQDISADWRFLLFDDAGMESTDYISRRGWITVNLPHTWNTKDIFDDVPGYYRGPGWYRREIEIPSDWRDKSIFLRFEAAAQAATVWVNNVYVGAHKGAFTPFEFDITKIARPGERNLVAVRVDNRWRRDIPPYDMDFNMMGGLHREVYLIVTDKVHIASVRVTTPRVSRPEATVALEIEVRNDGEEDQEVAVEADILDPATARVSLSRASAQVSAGSTAVLQPQPPAIANPRLWSPDAPALYRVRFTLRAGERIADEDESPLGFRWYRFDAEKGFFLNGAPLKLRGANRHDDYPGLGWALPVSRQVQDVRLVKEIGCNFIRLAHYAQHPSVLDACDRLGLLVWEEAPFDGEGEQLAPYTGARDFAETTMQMLRETIRRDRNHPSIILWSMGNENLNGATEEEWRTVADLTRELAALSKKEDPSRPTAVAINRFDRADVVGMMDLVDVVGCNVYSGWYGGKFEDFGRIVDDIHRKHPTKPLIISEYGAGMELGRHSDEPRRYDFSEEWGCMFHESYLKQINERPFIAGSLLWNIFDFAVEKRLAQTIPHMNQKGIYDYYRRPKDVYYLYVSQWTAKPMVYIVSHTWTERHGLPGESKTIKVYSNCDSVELFLNGKSAGLKEKGDVFAWQATFDPGDNQLRVVGRKGKEKVEDSVRVRY